LKFRMGFHLQLPWTMTESFNALTNHTFGAAINVHRELGPGLLESAYQACLGFELIARGLNFECQKALPLVYRGRTLNCGYRIDFLVERNRERLSWITCARRTRRALR
jgi:PD-(D/E)XK nuclease superfamily